MGRRDGHPNYYTADLYPVTTPLTSLSTTTPSTGRQARPHAGRQRREHRADEVILHLLTHAWVARAVRLPVVLVVQRARFRDALAVHLPRPLRQPASQPHRPAGALRRRCRACGPPSWYCSLAPESVLYSLTSWCTAAGVARRTGFVTVW
jgi:hypothetical protein